MRNIHKNKSEDPIKAKAVSYRRDRRANQPMSSNYINDKCLINNVNQLRISLDQMALSAWGSRKDLKLFLYDKQKEWGDKSSILKHNGNYQRSILLRWEGPSKIRLFYNPVKLSLRPIWIVFERPSISLLSFLTELLTSYNCSHTVSKVEIPFDFHTDNPVELQCTIENSIWLSRATNWTRYETTLYLNDPRNSVKAIRIYPKETSRQDRDKVRVELQLNRPKLKLLKINSMQNLLDAQLTDLVSDMSFRNYRWDIYESRKLRDAKAKQDSPASERKASRQVRRDNRYLHKHGFAAGVLDRGLPMDVRMTKENAIHTFVQERIAGKLVRDILRP